MSSVSLAKFLLVLILVQALPRVCRGEAPLATKDDIDSLSSLLRELLTPKQCCAQQGEWQGRVSTVEATLRSMETTMNRLLNENAQLMNRLSALEASPNCDIVAARPPECPPPFTEVMGRCVFADTSVSGLWENMRNHCRDMGADMVVVDSADFLWYLVQHLEATHQDTVNYWVGGHRTRAGGVFHWVDGTPIKTGTPFWGHHKGFGGRQPYDNTEDLGICMWKTQFHFLHSCSNGHVQSVICQHK